MKKTKLKCTCMCHNPQRKDGIDPNPPCGSCYSRPQHHIGELLKR